MSFYNSWVPREALAFAREMQLIENAQYPGYYSEMDLIAISIEDGELRETTV